MFENYKDIVGIEELTQMLDIGKSKVYKLVNSGEINSFKVGKVHKIPKQRVIEFIEKQKLTFADLKK